MKTRKDWEKRRQKKLIRKRQRNKKNHYNVPQYSAGRKKELHREHNIIVNEHFSIIKYREETLKFFSTVFDIIDECKLNQRIYFDLSGISFVTADAVMYLIAVITNSRRLRTLNIHCGGNMPQNKEAAYAFQKVGFYDYFKCLGKKPKDLDEDRIKILHGRDLKPQVIASVCDYVNRHDESGKRRNTKRLYTMFVELMTNVKQHAYQNGELGNMSPRWYMYVEDHSTYIEFVFLDTGRGIPSTVKKRVIEKISDFAGGQNDSNYILGALNGEFRTETGQLYRGKGLPEIRDAVISEEDRIDQMSVISGYGECLADKNGLAGQMDMSYALEGTLFSWIYRKE